MRIGLVDVEGHNFPNLALMKLSTYHKQLGDKVEWANSLEPFDKITPQSSGTGHCAELRPDTDRFGVGSEG